MSCKAITGIGMGEFAAPNSRAKVMRYLAQAATGDAALASIPTYAAAAFALSCSLTPSRGCLTAFSLLDPIN